MFSYRVGILGTSTGIIPSLEHRCAEGEGTVERVGFMEIFYTKKCIETLE